MEQITHGEQSRKFDLKKLFTKDLGKSEGNKDDFNIEEVIERLRINDADVINEVFSQTRFLCQSEEEHGKVIDTKAFNLFSIIGVLLTLTVVGSIPLMGFYLQKGIPSPLLQYLRNFIKFNRICLGFSFVACVMSLISIIPKNYRGVSWENILKESEIDKDINSYKRFLSAHYLEIFCGNYKINQKKGKFLKSAHVFFLIALCLLVISYVFLSKGLLSVQNIIRK